MGRMENGFKYIRVCAFRSFMEGEARDPRPHTGRTCLLLSYIAGIVTSAPLCLYMSKYIHTYILTNSTRKKGIKK